MTINIFAHIGEVKIEDHLFQYSMIANDNKNESFQQFLEDNIPKTYCDYDTPLDKIMNVVFYAYNIGAALTIHTYDSSKLEVIEDWSKINNNIKFNVDIVF